MATIGSSIAQINASISGGLATPTITNASTSGLANTETSIALPAGTRSICIQNSDDGLIQFAFTATESGTNFFTLFPGVPYHIEGISASASVTLYVQSPKTSQALQIISWA